MQPSTPLPFYFKLFKEECSVQEFKIVKILKKTSGTALSDFDVQ